jgi:hypothetical protein
MTEQQLADLIHAERREAYQAGVLAAAAAVHALTAELDAGTTPVTPAQKLFYDRCRKLRSAMAQLQGAE